MTDASWPRRIAAGILVVWLATELIFSGPTLLRSVHRRNLSERPQLIEVSLGNPSGATLMDIGSVLPSKGRVVVLWDQPADSYEFYRVSYWLAPRTVAFGSIVKPEDAVLVIGPTPAALGAALGSRRLLKQVASGGLVLSAYGPAA